MIGSICHLSDAELRDLALSIQAGRITAPFTNVALQRLVSPQIAGQLAGELEALRAAGSTPAAIATVFDALWQDRQKRESVKDVIDLVTTGPEASSVANRDTSVVVRELFANVRRSVLVAGFAVYQGQRVFSALADRMHACPDLNVRMFLDIQRPQGDTSAPAELVWRFSSRFVTTQWPPDRPLPTVYYYPPSLELEPARRSSLHAKCVVVDGRAAFVSSANFTEAAQQRNVEVGVLIRSDLLAGRITCHFDALVADGFMWEVHLPRLH